jgi:hypothetical protein
LLCRALASISEDAERQLTDARGTYLSFQETATRAGTLSSVKDAEKALHV